MYVLISMVEKLKLASYRKQLNLNRNTLPSFAATFTPSALVHFKDEKNIQLGLLYLIQALH